MRRYLLTLCAVLCAAVAAACTQDASPIQVGNVVSVVVWPDSVDLRIGDSVVIHALPLDSSKTYHASVPVTWSSDHPDIATVDTNGKLTGKGSGVATITASADGLKGSAMVYVQPAPRLLLDRTVVTFTAQAGGANPASDTIIVRNGGGFTLTGLRVDSVSYDSGAAGWLVAVMDSTTAPTTLRLNPMISGITTPGTYKAHVHVSASDADSSPQAVTATLTMTAGTPASLMAVQGDSQSAAVHTAVATAPAVRVRDAFQNPAPGVAVVFTPAKGGGTVTGDTAMSDSVGVATVGAWQLGDSVGENQLSAAVAGVASVPPVTFTATGTPGGAAAVAVAGGNGQTATVGTAVATAPSVKVTDAFGNVVPGAAVTFTASAGNGKVTGGTATTDAAGLATVGTWTLDTLVGTDTLVATATGATTSARFTATAGAGAAAQIAIYAGNGQSDTLSGTLPVNPTVRVADRYGNAVQGVSVAFAVTGGGGSVGSSSGTSNAQGLASTTWTVGGAPGANTMSATSAGLSGSPLTFTATATAGAPAQIAITQGDGQTAAAGSMVPVAPAVRITDAQGNAVAGVGVTFSVSTGGGSVTGGAAITDASGIATVGSWTLGPTIGANTLVADAGGGLAATFTATATAAAPDTIAIVAGNNQSATAGTPVSTAPSVRVADKFGNPVSGVAVTFAPSAGGTVNPTTPVSTDASGMAALTSWTLSSTAGTNTLTASITATASVNQVSFTATGTAGAAGGLKVATQPSASDTSGTAFARQPVVQLVDGNNNPVSTAGVNVTASIASGPVGTLGGTLTVATNSSGQAVFTNLVITGLTGSYQLGFGGTGLSGATSSGITLAAGPADTIFATTATSQSGTAGQAVATPPAVEVTDVAGNPIAGVSVTFDVTAGAGSTSPASGSSVITDASGIAALTSWTLGTGTGTNTVTATSGTLGGSPVTFTATATAGTAATLSKVAGDGQTDTVGASVTPPSVNVVDQYGNPVAGVPVKFTVTGGGGSTVPASGNSVNTDASGNAALTSWTLGSTPGSNTVQASVSGTVAGNPATFTATATVGSVSAANSIVSASPGTITASNGSATSTITVTVRDGFNNPISGASVVLASSLSPASFTALAATDVNGQTTSSFSSTKAGNHSITATADGVAITHSGTVTVNPDVSSSTQSTMNVDASTILADNTGSTAGYRSVATVTDLDQFGNPRSGDVVTFSPSNASDFWRVSTSNSTSSSVDTTDASGIAQRVFYSTLAGGKTLSASVGAAFSKSDSITVSPAAASAVQTSFAASPNTITASSTGSTAGTYSTLTVTVKDAYGNVRSGDNVAFSSNGSNDVFRSSVGGASSTSGTTNGFGQVVRYFNSQTAQTKTLTAAVTPTLGNAFNENANVTVNAASPTQIAVYSGNGQSAVTGNYATNPIYVLVRDVYNNPVSGVTVSWSPSSPGSVLYTTSSTNANGLALTYWLLRTGTPGAYNANGTYTNTLDASINSGTLTTLLSGYAYFSYLSNVDHVWSSTYGTSTPCTGCHVGTAPSGNLRLDQTASLNYAQLVGVLGTCDPSYYRVKTGGGSSAATSSILYELLDQQAIGTCAYYMPFGGPPLPTATLDTIRAWIQKGAPN